MYMSERQVWISRSKKMLPVIAEARESFPDAGGDSQALARALFHWYHDRQNNSKRGALARLEERLIAVEDELAEMKLMLRQLLGDRNAPDY